MTRAELMRVIRECQREAAKMRKMYPSAYRWAEARLPQFKSANQAKERQ